MEISQLELFSLLAHSAVGGVLLGILRDVLNAFCLSFSLLLAQQNETVLPKKLPKKLDEEMARLRERKIGRSRRAAFWVFVAIIDIVFMMSSAVMLIVISYACNSGRMRWMLVFGLALGFFVYRSTIGRLVKSMLSVSAIAVRCLMVRIFKMMCAPFRVLNKKCILSKSKRKGGLHCEKK